MKPVVVLIPEGLDIETLVNVHSPHLDADYLRYLIYIVLSKIAFKFEDKERKKLNPLSDTNEVYKAISSQNLLVSHRKHKEHIDFLRSDILTVTIRKSRTRFVEIKQSILHSKRYKVGQTSYRYKLNPILLKKRLKVEYIKSPKLSKIKDSLTVIPSLLRGGKFRFLGKYFDSNKLEINFDDAVCLCEERYSKHKDFVKYVSELNQLIDLKNGCYRIYYHPDTDGRIHSNITKLPKVYRKFLSYEGRRLVEVDLSNSIIFFLSMIVTVHSNLGGINIYLSDYLLMFAKTLRSLDVVEKELLEQTAVSGRFYDLFIEDFKSSYSEKELGKMHKLVSSDVYDGSYKQIRKIAKKQLLAMIFAEETAYMKIQRIFRKKFQTY